VVHILNEYFDSMVSAVDENGACSKVHRDAIMVHFGSPRKAPTTLRAVKTGLRCSGA
jgi:class 3 adenylate cyclase